MSLLDPILRPLLQLPVLWIILIISLVIAVLITVIYKLMTDQNLMKQLKSELKEFQKEMKELKDHPEKRMEVQKKAMQTNMKYMMHSMKSTLVTFIPIIFIFGWMNANIAYDPIVPGQEFTITAAFAANTAGTISLDAPEGISTNGNSTKQIEDGKVIWVLKGKEGEYLLEYAFNNEKHSQEVLITESQAYKPAVTSIKNSKLKKLEINNKPKKVMNLGFWNVGWLGTYIIFSIIFSMLLRKILKVY